MLFICVSVSKQHKLKRSAMDWFRWNSVGRIDSSWTRLTYENDPDVDSTFILSHYIIIMYTIFIRPDR